MAYIYRSSWNGCFQPLFFKDVIKALYSKLYLLWPCLCSWQEIFFLDITTVLSGSRDRLVHADREMLQINCGVIEANYSDENFPRSKKFLRCHPNYVVFSDGSLAGHPNRNITKNIKIPQKYSCYGSSYWPSVPFKLLRTRSPFPLVSVGTCRLSVPWVYGRIWNERRKTRQGVSRYHLDTWLWSIV